MCKHRPTGNGWSSHYSRVNDEMRLVESIAWCGRCKDYMPIDVEWSEKFEARGKSAPIDPRTLA